MKVLVTGATGFTGGHLARQLAARGNEVRALVRAKSLARFAASVLPAAGITAIEGDLLAPDALVRACDGVEVVYHIAATYREAGQPDSAYRAINVDGTRHLLEAARAAGARRLVHCSTGGVHGHVAHPPANEDAPFNPGDVYQDTKLEAETMAREFGVARDFEVVVARPIGIHGPGDTRFLRMFKGLARGRFPMLGSGAVFYHLTYIDDLVEGFRLCGEVPGARGRTYILAGETYLTPRLGAALAAAPAMPSGPPDNLTERELQVLRLIALGHTNAEIGGQIYVSVRTIESHRAHIQQKLGRSTRAELVRYALDHGLLDDE